MRRWILSTVLLLAFLATSSPATAAAAADCDDQKSNFGQRLECWKQLAAGDPAKVTIKDPIEFDKSGTIDALTAASPIITSGALEVSVPGKAETGKGGTVLLLLSPDRRISPDSTITGLDQKLVDELRKAHLCDQPRDKALCDKVASGNSAKGKDLLKEDGLATKLNEGGGGPFGGPLTYLLIALVAAGLLMIVFLLVRRSPTPRTASGPSPGPAPSPPVNHAQPTRTPRTAPHPSHLAAPAAGPRVTAILRTDLHPQGYVELDNCLFRAAWCDADVPPPALGEPIEVVKGSGRDADLLLAYPPGAGR